jgi:hypothetical protein
LVLRCWQLTTNSLLIWLGVFFQNNPFLCGGALKIKNRYKTSALKIKNRYKTKNVPKY